mgnify:FL=1
MRRIAQALVAVLAGFTLGVGLWITVPESVTSRAHPAAGEGCWGSICQTSAGLVKFSKSLNPSEAIGLSTAPGVIQFPGDFTLACTRGPVIGPGGAALTVRARPSLRFPGAMKLTVIAGGGQTETTLLDPVPGGTC